MQLSQNFTLYELTKSSTASRLGIDNSPDDWQLSNLTHLAENILQPVRIRFGPTRVSSALRVIELNRAVGSGDSSQHPKGEAADFEVVNISNYEVAAWIEGNLDFDQLILEFHTPGDPNSGWIHCSIRRDGKNRKSVLTAYWKDGKVVYVQGLME